MPDTKINPQEVTSPQSTSEGSYFSRLFSGRLGRANYFYGMLWINLGIPLILIVPIFVLALIGIPSGAVFIVQLLYSPAWILYSFSFIIRRLHDFNKSGWLSLIMLIPIVNIILGLFLLFKKGDETVNSYGAPPKLKLDARLVFNIKPKPEIS